MITVKPQNNNTSANNTEEATETRTPRGARKGRGRTTESAHEFDQVYTMDQMFGEMESSVGNGSGISKEVIEKFNELSKGQNKGITAITVYDQTVMPMPVIALIRGNKYLSVLIPANGIELRNIPETRDGVSYEIDVVASHAHDDDLIFAVEDYILKAMPEKTTLEEVAYIVLPASIDLTDNIIAILIDQANHALRFAEKGMPDINAGSLAASLDTMAAVNYIDFHGGATVLDAFGRPVASDISATMEMVQRRNRNTPQAAANRRIVLAHAEARVDFMYDPEQVDDRRDRNAKSYGYHPLVVITDCGAYTSGRSLETPVVPFLAAAALSPVMGKMNFLQVFDSERKPSIGLLGWEHNPFPNETADYGEVKINNFFGDDQDATNIHQFAKSFLYDDATMAIDLEFGGRASWSYQLIIDAVTHPGGKADMALATLLDQYTNGYFIESLGRNSVFHKQAEYVIIHMGTYDDGKIKDLREVIDNLAMCQTMTANIADAADMLDTMVPGGDSQIGLDIRRKTINMMFGDNAKIESMGLRVILPNDVIMALLDAMAQNELVFETEGLDTRRSRTRGSRSNTGSASSSDWAASANSVFSGRNVRQASSARLPQGAGRSRRG